MAQQQPAESFELATALSGGARGEFTWLVPDGWQQGRGAWGGLVVGAMVTAVEQAQGEPHRVVRSLTCEIPAPVLAGEHLVTATCVRRGSSASTWRAEIRGLDGSVRAAATIVTGADRDVTPAVVPPACPPPVALEACEPWQMPVPPGPSFARHLQFRPHAGMPATQDHGGASGWVSFAVPTPWTAASLLALVDSWWPASLAAEAALRPMATVTFAATVCVPPASLAPGSSLWFEGRTTAQQGGFTSESRRLVTAGGLVAVENLQSIVVIA